MRSSFFVELKNALTCFLSKRLRSHFTCLSNVAPVGLKGDLPLLPYLLGNLPPIYDPNRFWEKQILCENKFRKQQMWRSIKYFLQDFSGPLSCQCVLWMPYGSFTSTQCCSQLSDSFSKLVWPEDPWNSTTGSKYSPWILIHFVCAVVLRGHLLGRQLHQGLCRGPGSSLRSLCLLPPYNWGFQFFLPYGGRGISTASSEQLDGEN